MPDRKITIEVFRSIQKHELVAVTAGLTGESERNVIRYRRVIKGFERGESDWLIKNAVGSWSEESIKDMRLWAIEEKIISPPVSFEISEAAAIVQRSQLKDLAPFVSGFIRSLVVPAPTALSGVEEQRWPAPYSGPLESPPLIRVVESKKGQKNFNALLTVMPMPDLAPTLASARSSLLAYAKTAKDLAAHVSTVCADLGTANKSGIIPPGVILATMHCWIESCGSDRPSGLVSLVETGQGGKSILRMGGWSAEFTDRKRAEQTLTIFRRITKNVTKIPEIQKLMAARCRCENAMADARELLKSKVQM